MPLSLSPTGQLFGGRDSYSHLRMNFGTSFKKRTFYFFKAFSDKNKGQGGALKLNKDFISN